jgi:hypothetical protein
MIWIAHRGLYLGPNSGQENKPSQVQMALNAGFDVELDVWFQNNKFFLGHDKPQYEVPKEFFFNYKMWLHAKDIPTFLELKSHPVAEVFFHQEDQVAITSGKYLWTYPNKNNILTKDSIAVMPERVGKWKDIESCAGICSDFISNYKNDVLFRLPEFQDEIIPTPIVQIT